MSEQLSQLSHNSDPVVSLDTPVSRATINMMTIQELDEFLNGIRERRLARVKKLEDIAKIKAGQARLATYLKFERMYAAAKKLLDRMHSEEEKAEAAVNRLRVIALDLGAEI